MPKHTYTLDPMKSEWAEYAAVQAECGTRQGTLGYSRSKSQCGLILA